MSKAIFLIHHPNLRLGKDYAWIYSTVTYGKKNPHFINWNTTKVQRKKKSRVKIDYNAKDCLFCWLITIRMNISQKQNRQSTDTVRFSFSILIFFNNNDLYHQRTIPFYMPSFKFSYSTVHYVAESFALDFYTRTKTYKML